MNSDIKYFYDMYIKNHGIDTDKHTLKYILNNHLNSEIIDKELKMFLKLYNKLIKNINCSSQDIFYELINNLDIDKLDNNNNDIKNLSDNYSKSAKYQKIKHIKSNSNSLDYNNIDVNKGLKNVTTKNSFNKINYNY